MARLIGRRMTKEVNLLGALDPAARAVQLGLWNRVVPTDDWTPRWMRSSTSCSPRIRQAVRQLKFIINRGGEGRPLQPRRA